jgi:hypothetical protein
MKTRIMMNVVLVGMAAACGTNRATRTVTVTPQGDSIITHGDRAAPTVAGNLKQGTKVQAVLQDEVSSRNHKVGDYVTASLTKEIKDANGQVIFPAGTETQLQITQLQPPVENQSKGDVGFSVTGLKMNGRTYYVGSSVDRDSYGVQDRGPSVDRDKVIIGAGAGAVAGGLIAGSVKGAVVGGLLGGAAGAVVGSEMNKNRRDVVVARGTKVEFKLEQPVIVFAR